MRVALDTSVAVPFVMASHVAHELVRNRLGGSEVVLTSHSLAETYSVLTRLPGDARLAPLDAVELIDANFSDVLPLDNAVAVSVHQSFAALGIVGGAVFDALIALAAREAQVALATRDGRAVPTYAALGVAVELIVD